MGPDLNEVLTRYFKRLSQVGYVPDNEVCLVIILDYITDIRNNNLLSEEDNTIIDSALSCMYGNCLIPFTLCKGNCV